MSVRVATYNLFEGAGGSYNRLVEFVRTSQLDVICLQEINGWEDNDFARLKDFTDKVLFVGFAYGNSNTEYKLATVSKHAIIDRKLHAEAFWHAALEIKVRLGDRDVTIVNAHLDPWKEESRDREIARLLSGLQPGQPTIITGDFNSLSRQDNYPPELLAQLQAKGISKFGTQSLELRVIDRLLAAGYVDVFAAAGQFQPTVPSAFNQDKDHEVPVRVDYMFVSPDLAPLVSKVELAKTDLTDAISDHYPLIVTFNLGEPETGTSPTSAAPAPVMPPAPVPAPVAPSIPAAPPTPWVPPEDPKPQERPPKNDDKPDDGEVVMWSHDDKK
ncbi:MAG TPA: endonuclease/exonuclease/phosphatase family protein [Candidatus Saccharimonadales bacterium]